MTLTFLPFFSLYWLLALVPFIVGLLYFKLFTRAFMGGGLALLIANPTLKQEVREKLPTTVAVLVDDSSSNKLGLRAQETRATEAKVIEALQELGFETRVIKARDQRGTLLFEALKNGLMDLSPSRLGGVIAITDGQVHDNLPALNAPFHALITGSVKDKDRRIALESAPKFGIVGQTVEVRFKIIDEGVSDKSFVKLTLNQDNQPPISRSFEAGKTITLTLPVTTAGANLIDLSVEPMEGELTVLNNRLAVTVEGVRERLRVLLVSGAPHAGERTWRNLLKSDPTVELVHFTILRPQNKANVDNTPTQELSLIAFPTRDLFVNKLTEFDLIIFDRYAQIGLIPQQYYDNIARYVETGGALLLASGPEFAKESSLTLTPLDRILPARPLGVTEKPFNVKLSPLGLRHPVTKQLDLAKAGKWQRFVSIDQTKAVNLLQAGESPLLLLSREKKGRVGLLLSDDVYLWARGYDGGGPHAELMRRLSHWLMKEPDLEEERLFLAAQGADILISRQTLKDETPLLSLLSPSGVTHEMVLTAVNPGLFKGVLKEAELGLWKVTSGDETRLFMMGPQNPREWQEVVSTDKILPNSYRLENGLPRIVSLSGSSNMNGLDWIGVRENYVTSLKSLSLTPVLIGFMGLLTLLIGLAMMWQRESK